LKLIKVTDRDARSGRALFLLRRCSNPPLYARKIQSAAISLFLFLCASTVLAASSIELKSDSSLATAGYYQLTWSWPEAPAGINYELEELSSTKSGNNSHDVYFGPDLASVISGKPNGTYRYLVSAIAADHKIVAQSNPLEVVVKHHSLIRAISIFILGALVFMAILFVILRESKNPR
jgi:hypothetical protein